MTVQIRETDSGATIDWHDVSLGVSFLEVAPEGEMLLEEAPLAGEITSFGTTFIARQVPPPAAEQLGAQKSGRRSTREER